MILPFLVSFFCLIGEAFFSSAEIAIVSADRAFIRRLAESGHKGAKLVEEFLQAPHRLLAVTLLGTQLSLVTSTVVMTLWLHRHFDPTQAEFYLILGLTPIVVIFGEIVPKSLVKQHANEWAPTMARILSIAMKALLPLVALLSRASARLSSKLGIKGHRKLISREELEWLITSKPPTRPQEDEVTMVPSDVTEGERSMIARILELSESTVTDLMVPLSGVTALPETATLEEISQNVIDKKYSRIPIFRDRLDHIIGVVHAFDVLKAGNASRKIAADLMRTPLFVPESQRVTELLSHMQKMGQNLAVVVDEYGGAVGIITQEDVLEEVVGEIEDEFDVPQTMIYKEPDGSYRVSASISIAELNQKLSLELPESDEYESIAGLILEQLKRIPRAGEILKIGTVTLMIHTANQRRVEEVRIRKGM